ncbi:MAG: uracil-DNA glycosylase family protein [Thermoleophilaceae bacterium]
MKTEQVNIRLEPATLAALEHVARAESLDRGTVIRRFIESSIYGWQLDRAIEGYRRGELTVGRAAEEAGLSQWELIDTVRERGIAYPLEAEEIREWAAAGDMSSGAETLPVRPPAPGGVLLVGINPAPASVAAGHYYQGRLGKRLWRTLERCGLLDSPVPGAEDDAFVQAGNGLADVVRRATASAAELTREELQAGAAELREAMAEWRPRLVLFVFKGAAVAVLGTKAVKPGRGPEVDGVPSFLLAPPYESRERARGVEAELTEFAGGEGERQAGVSGGGAEEDRSQTVTQRDRDDGRIRFPGSAKPFFPHERGQVEVVLRGTRLSGRWDPRFGPDRERSGVLCVDGARLRGLVGADERLRVSRGLGGVVRLD